jgi:hypothetical protein
VSRAAVLLLLLATLAAAQAGPDSTARPQLRTKSPGTAVLLSLFIPGGGQAYVGQWWKTALIAPAEAALGYCSYRAHLDASAALGRQDTAAYVAARDKRATFLWLTGATIAFSMADAYVSAKFYGFDREMQLSAGPGRVGISARVW